MYDFMRNWYGYGRAINPMMNQSTNQPSNQQPSSLMQLLSAYSGYGKAMNPFYNQQQAQPQTTQPMFMGKPYNGIGSVMPGQPIQQQQQQRRVYGGGDR